jgi:DNA (cytosine-5)-methyltransferase 1
LVAFGGNDTRSPIDVSTALNAHGGPAGRLDFESETFVTHALRGEGFDASEDGTGRGTPIVPCAYSIQAGALRENPESGPDGVGVQPEIAYTLEARAEVQAVAFVPDLAATLTRGAESQGKGGYAGRRQEDDVNLVAFDLRNGSEGDVSIALQSGGMGDERGLCPNALPHTIGQFGVRRLMPVECERLQGFPDDYTVIPGAADGPRYKALGNSMAVPVMAWIGARILAAWPSSTPHS